MKTIRRDELIKELENVANVFKNMANAAIKEHDIVNTHIIIGYANTIHEAIALLKLDEKHMGGVK